MVKQVYSTSIPLSAQKVLGTSRCHVLEILNDILNSGLGISFLENVITTKEGVEYSVLPAYSGIKLEDLDVRMS